MRARPRLEDQASVRHDAGSFLSAASKKIAMPDMVRVQVTHANSYLTELIAQFATIEERLSRAGRSRSI